jgi:hypothetical protein
MASQELLRSSALGVAIMGMATGVLVSCAPQQVPPPGAVAAPDQTSTEGTATLTGGAVALGVGLHWGSGILTFRGRQYPFNARGLSALEIGAARLTISGTVRNLHKVADFNGHYVAVRAGAAIGVGGGVSTLRNQNGVIIEGISTAQGLGLTLGGGGINITLSGPDWEYAAEPESISHGTEP